MEYKKIVIKKYKNLDKKITEKLGKNNEILYYQKLEDNLKVAVYSPFVVQISNKLKQEIENFLEKLIKNIFQDNINLKEILDENIFRIDGVLDKNNNFNIVEINSHFPRLYMLNFKSLKEYGLITEYKKLKNLYQDVFLKNGKYKKINIIFDENIHAIEYNKEIFLEVFGDIIDNVYSLKDLQDNFDEVKRNLEKNPNIYRMVIKTSILENFLKKAKIKNLRCINSLQAGKIGEKDKLSKVKSDILPDSEYIVLDKDFVVPENKVLKISDSAEGKGVFLPNEKYLHNGKNKIAILQNYINIPKMKLKNKEEKFRDINFVIIKGKVVSSIIRLSDSKIVNVSAGGGFASCILENI